MWEDLWTPFEGNSGVTNKQLENQVIPKQLISFDSDKLGCMAVFGIKYYNFKYRFILESY